MKTTRILVGAGGGLVIGLACLVQVLGWASWFPEGPFEVLHTPALLLTTGLVHGEAGWSVIPFAVVAQWVLTGAVVGLVYHVRRES